MVAILPMLLGMGLGTAMGMGTGLFGNPLSVAANKVFPVNPLPPPNAIAGLWRGEITQQQYQEELRASGLNETNAQLMQQVTRPLADTTDLITAFRRKLLGSDEASNKDAFILGMGKLGISAELAELLLSTNEIIGNPSDLVRFLVREVFSPELRKQLELDNEYPEAADAEFARLGISPAYARNIWAAHWVLPAIGQMAIAFHRYRPERREMWEAEVRSMGLEPDQVQTDINDISQLLKFQDVGTKYRQRMLSILFRNPGQIQLRWLIRFRFLTYEEAVYYFERQGLPPTLAEQITQVSFCVQSITDWKAAIKAGASTWEDVSREMDEWHVTSERVRSVVKIKVAPEQAEGVADERKLSKAVLLDAFDLDQITEDELRQSLADLNYGQEQIDIIVNTHLAEASVREAKELKRQGLTRGEIKKGIRNNTFDRNEAVRLLQITGMSAAAASELYDLERGEDAR